MNLRQFRRKSLDINLTPLIDVVFLLLIFFMVSTTFNRETEISVDLPDATATTLPTDEQSIEITISEDGRYYINQQLVINTQIKTLRSALTKVLGDRKSPPLTIIADAKTPHQSVVTAMDVARQLGLVHISIATQQTK